MPFRRDPDHCYRVPAWDRYSWLEHGFGTRHTKWPDPRRCATVKQVHSAETSLVSEPGCAGYGDALLTSECGIYLAIRTADCVPLLLVDPANRAVAAVHAGWRGASEQIALKTVNRMTAEFGTQPQELEVAIGPAIGACCYEVGPEVASRFKRLFPDRADLDGRALLDLPEANRRQLVDTGVSPSRIFVAQACTYCHPQEFHSFRRDAEAAGRLVSAVGLLP